MTISGLFEALLTVLATLVTVGVIVAEYRRTNDLLTPLHLAWGFFGFFYLLSFLHIVRLGNDVYLHPFSDPQTTAITTLFHLFSATVALTIGYYSSLGNRGGKFTARQLPKTDLSPRSGRRLGIALFTVGLAATAIFVWKNGGPSELLAAPNVFVFRTAPNSLRYWLLLQIGLFAGLSLYLSAARFNNHHRLPYLLCLFLTGLFFIMHSRARAVFAVILLGLYAWYADDRVTMPRLIGLGVASLAGFAVFRPIEMVLQGDSLSRAVSLLHYYIFVETGGAFLYTDYFQGYMALVEGVPQRVPFQWGRTFISVPWLQFGLFTEMRGAASDPMRITELAVYGYNRPNIATTANGFGVLYMNFSFWGLLLGATVYGVVFRMVYTVWQQTQSSVFIGAIYFVTIYYFYMILSGGPLAYNVLLVLLVLRVLWLVVNVRPKSILETMWEDLNTGVFSSLLEVLGAKWEHSKTESILTKVRIAWQRSAAQRIMNNTENPSK